MGELNNKIVESRKLKVKSGFQSGQSLIELLIAIGVAGIFITGAMLSVDVALRSTAQNKQVQPASFLAQELMDAVVVAARTNWQQNIAAPTLGNPYFISVGVSTAGKEASSPLNGVTYQRFFTISDASPVDASKKLIMVTVEWPAASPTNNITLARYVTRNQNAVFRQTDWSGGGGQSGIFADATKFDVQSPSGGMHTSEGGSIYLEGFSAP